MNQNNDDSVFVLGKNIENLFNNSNINLARTESIILLSYFLKLSKEVKISFSVLISKVLVA